MKYQLLPPLSQDDEKRLRASIVERGVKMPVVFDEDGNILDGHNRVMIADSLGIEYPRIIESGLDEHEKRIFVAELNAARRQLTMEQKVILGRQIEPDIRVRAEKRRLANLKKGDVAPSATNVTVGDEPKRATDEVARAVQIGSGRTYERASKLIDEVRSQPDGDQLYQHIESGDWTLDDARQELKTRKLEAQRKAMAPPELMVSPEARQTLNKVMNGAADDIVMLTMSQDALRLSGRLKIFTSDLLKLPPEYRQQAVDKNPKLKTEYETVINDALKLVGHLRDMLGDAAQIRRVS